MQYPPNQFGQNQQQLNEPIGVGEMPMDNATGVPAPSAPPPMQDMDRIEGYQRIVDPNVSFVPPPPSYADAMKQQRYPSTPEQFGQRAQLTPDEARACLLRLVQDQCCWGKSAVKSMAINNIHASCAVHYILRTYLETRVTDWAHEAFIGQPIDVSANGVPPQPWQIQVPTPQFFVDQVTNIEVPHTASVKTCHHCRGQAMLLCHMCNGWGYRRCMMCSGRGFDGTNERRSLCYHCNGSGRRRCYHCEGVGRVPCPECQSTGRVKYYINLAVHFRTHISDFILEGTRLPNHLIRDVAGTATFEDTQQSVNPVRTFPAPEVNMQSDALIREHRELARSGRILMQNHVIREVPVFQCDCTYKSKPLQFFVIGHDRMVYIEDYPEKCCWGCQLL